ncbi:MAG: 4'-phosphopantetheinyl transferase family protein [Jatrophihabitans sp.]
MIEAILPEWVAAVESRQDCAEDQLFPAEREVIANAVSKRRAEFNTVRACARAALHELGIAPAPILPGQRGAPQWPPGVVGSMTHCDGYRAAAVCHDRRAVSIGLDAEPHAPLPDGVLGIVARTEEREHLAALAQRDSRLHWDRLLFTMKESVYKAWFPLTQLWLDFQQASVRIEPSTGHFVAALLVPGPVVAGVELAEFHGRFLVEDDLALSAIVLPAR